MSQRRKCCKAFRRKFLIFEVLIFLLFLVGAFCETFCKDSLLGVGKIFRLLMQSCLFSRPFNEIFKFLKNRPCDFYKICHSHSTPKRAPLYAMASKSYDCNVRNIAKISPKMVKKPFSDFFRFSQKLPIRFERNFLVVLHRIKVLMCKFIKII